MDKGEIRDIANSVLNRKRSESTERQYLRDYERLDGADWRQYAEAHGLSRRSAYKLKAAWQVGAARDALDRLKEADRAAKAGDKDRAREARSEAASLAARIRDGADYERKNRFDTSRKAAYQGTHPKRGKRGSLKGLPKGWQAQVIEAAEDRDKLAVWTMALSGARPAEVEKGITVEARNDGVRFIIRGAKTSQGYGQEWRAFTATGPEAQRMARWMQKRGHQALDVGIPPNGKNPLGNFRKRISKAAERAGMPDVSAYSMRHAVASEMKAAGVDSLTAAGALGHSVDGTIQMYGHPYQGAGGMGVENLETAQEVRQTAQEPMPERQPEPDLGPEADGPGMTPGM